MTASIDSAPTNPGSGIHEPSRCYSSNGLLSAVPREELEQLEPRYRHVDLEEGQILFEPGQGTWEVLFPEAGLLSISQPCPAHGESSVGIAGRKSVVCALPQADGSAANIRAKVEISGRGIVVPAEALQAAGTRGCDLQKIVDSHRTLQAVQASLVPGCVASHPTDARLAYWLLLAQDEIEHAEIRLSLSFLSYLLRCSYTDTILAAAVLWQKGYIRFSHDQTTIVNRQGLLEHCCACYAVVQSEHERLAEMAQGAES